MTIAVDLGRKATKQKALNIFVYLSGFVLFQKALPMADPLVRKRKEEMGKFLCLGQNFFIG